jgi:hypothetical protein
MSTFKGSGSTVEEAITAAAKEAGKAWKPRRGGDMVRIRLESIDIILGGFIAMREATVSLQEEPNAQPDRRR